MRRSGTRQCAAQNSCRLRAGEIRWRRGAGAKACAAGIDPAGAGGRADRPSERRGKVQRALVGSEKLRHERERRVYAVLLQRLLLRADVLQCLPRQQRHLRQQLRRVQLPTALLAVLVGESIGEHLRQRGLAEKVLVATGTAELGYHPGVPARCAAATASLKPGPP